jgi:diketogulonate reductase-like aldo/keto reductase
MKKVFLIVATIILNIITMNAQNQPYLTLNNGVKMPQFGLGVYSIPAGKTTYNSVLTALKAGYRHIDTAHAYGNERSVGEAVKDSGIPRDSIWITSKLWPNEYGEEITPIQLDKMLERLGLEYLDLVYLHQPLRDYNGGWKALEAAFEAGKVRAIGISDFDFSDELFNSIVEPARIKPQAFQIECHPYAQREHWQEMAKKYNIQIECWFPLGGRDSKGEILRNPVINDIAKAHGKSAAQVIIRWHIQKGFSVVPGSSNPKHIQENIEALDFTLTDAEMEQIHALNKEKRYFNMTYQQIKDWMENYEIWD